MDSYRKEEITVVVQSLSCVQLSATPCTAACQASLSFTISHSLLKHMSTESVMPSNHLILCHPLLLLPSIFPSISVFSNESAFCRRWPEVVDGTHQRKWRRRRKCPLGGRSTEDLCGRPSESLTAGYHLEVIGMGTHGAI